MLLPYQQKKEMAKTQLGKSSVGRKIIMAASGLFLLVFLLQHCLINFTSVLSADVFNELSHFMGTNFVVQYIFQPILIAGVVTHFVMGFILEAGNRKTRSVRYAKTNNAANSSWMSRNMIYTGLVILAFLGLHFYDFWIPELKLKFVEGVWDEPNRYYHELVHKFEDPVRVGLYCLSFILLSLHLLHGFGAAFQSVGTGGRYTPGIKKFGTVYAVVIPALFIFIAIYHHLNQ